jgi:hypothetical protein
MIAVLVYSFVSFEVVKYEDYVYPDYAYIAGWCITALGLSMLPLFAIIAVVKQKGNTFFEVRFNVKIYDQQNQTILISRNSPEPSNLNQTGDPEIQFLILNTRNF